jgi:nucleotide-binding universal stress UspA family protein
MITINKILYPTDFSSFSNQAYFHAIALAEKHGASLTILYVYEPDDDETVHGRHGEPDKHYWERMLEQIRPVDPTIPVSHILLEGDPATEIVRYAQDAGINLIVMGTHGRTGLERLLMGSVAEKVMRESSCSVLVVKLPRSTIPAEKSDEAFVTTAN